jgi:DNA helicase-2/ATP-dependent DNA helicase PcrA
MCLSQVLETASLEEKEIQKKIFNAIDEYKDIIFDAGAGAGKTYALIESLKYIINNKGKKLNYHNQNIICITYTNVATNEIKERLGNTKLVKVSTIHERLWDLIKNYQKQLVQIHSEKLNEKIEKINSELETEDKYKKYQELDEVGKENFLTTMTQNRESYYQSKDKRASEFKTAIKNFLNDEHHEMLTNVSHFKSLVGKLYKIQNYSKCLDKISNSENGYKEVSYDARFNNDRLHKMLISHDTLLEYAYKLIDKYDIIKQIIIDKYPYILVDEYQDTNEKVIKILNLLTQYAKQIKHNIFIGYFGDTAQNIYDVGVGSNIFTLYQDLENIPKKYNRRSANEIIQVINKIRNDEIRQETIYTNADCGLVEFYQGDHNNIENFIEKCKEDWDINIDNKLHCLVLTNELVAKYNGFENIYQNLKNTKYYKSNWQNITTQILSQDLSKLGVIPSLLYRIMDFKIKIENPETPIIDFVNEKIYENLTFNQLKELIQLLNSIDNSSFKIFIESIFQTYADTNNISYKKIVEEFFEIETYTFDGFLDYLLSQLFRDIESEEVEDSKRKLVELLEVNYNEYDAWYNFINKTEKEEVIYHTYHGTKGEEYDNVVIIMQNDFGTRDRNKFPFFFRNYINERELSNDELKKYTNTKNLLYVSCSRAIKNLRIFYLDDITEFRDGIESIFDTVERVSYE